MTGGTENYIENRTKQLEAELKTLKKIGSDFVNVQINIPLDQQNKAKEELKFCYDNIIYVLDQYLDMPLDQFKILAVWLIGTYYHKQFETYPFVFLNAMRGSGKTRCLKMLSWIQKGGNGDVLNSTSDSVVFRTAQETGLMFDEMEQIQTKDKASLREILNQAYKRGGCVKRVKKAFINKEEKMVVEKFDIYTPVALANIWGIDEVLGDRSIQLILEKSNNPAKTKKIEDFDTNRIIRYLKTKLNELSDVCDVTLRYKNTREKWNFYITNKYTTTHTTTTSITPLNTTEEDIVLNEQDFELFNKLDGAGIDGRNFELTNPLLLTANLIGEDVFEDMIRICKNLVAEKKDNEYNDSKDVSVYDFVSRQDLLVGYNYVKSLTVKFREFVGELDSSEDPWLNEKWFGRALKRLNLVASKKKDNRGSLVRLDVEKAKLKIRIFRGEVKDDKL